MRKVWSIFDTRYFFSVFIVHFAYMLHDNIIYFSIFHFIFLFFILFFFFPLYSLFTLHTCYMILSQARNMY
jgi:hypothetical protein